MNERERTGRAATLNTENQRLLFTRAHENDHSLPGMARSFSSFSSTSIGTCSAEQAVKQRSKGQLPRG